MYTYTIIHVILVYQLLNYYYYLYVHVIIRLTCVGVE